MNLIATVVLTLVFGGGGGGRVATVIVAPGVADYSTNELVALLDDVCVPTRFGDAACSNRTLLESFDRARFDFRRGPDVKRYAVWLRFVNNMEFYAPLDAPRLMTILARRSDDLASINAGLTADMRDRADEMFRWTVDTWSRFHDRRFDRFLTTFASFRNLLNAFVLWCDDDDETDAEYFVRALLHGYRSVRKSFRGEPAQRRLIDEAALQTISLAFEYPLLRFDAETIRRLVYIHYVIDVKEVAERAPFAPYLTVVDKNTTMPHVDRFRIDSFTTFVVHHGVSNRTQVDLMRAEARFVHANFVRFFDTLNITLKFYPATAIDVFVHADKNAYRTTGPLWAIRTDNGGFTHISSQTNRITAHVYFEAFSALPRNFGHELHHTLLYAVDEVDNMPAWYVEGSANRYGNRACYAFDHDSLVFYANLSVARTSAAGYEDDYLYGMGSALVAFLHDWRPQQLRRMIRARNYTIVADATIEADFALYKQNKIHECERVKVQTAGDGGRHTALDVQNEYLQYIDGETFATCPNYIQFDFDDVAFLMTPLRLIKINKRRVDDRINAQREIAKAARAPPPLSRQDFEWFVAGAFKRALFYLGDERHHFRPDRSNYKYDSNVTCQRGATKQQLQKAILRFASKTAVWRNFHLFANKSSIGEARQALADYFSLRSKCTVFLNPPTNITTVSARLLAAGATDAIGAVRKLDALDVVQRVDLRRNSLLHLAALNNFEVYRLLESKFGQLTRTLTNLDNMTPQELSVYARNYRLQFNTKPPSSLCFTFVDAPPTTIITTTTTTTTTSSSTTTRKPTTKIAIAPTVITSSTSTSTSTSISTSGTSTSGTSTSTSTSTTASGVEMDLKKNNTTIWLWPLLALIVLVLINVTIYLTCYNINNTLVNKKIKKYNSCGNNNNNNNNNNNIIKSIHDECTIELNK
uniref:Uncharacterized protein n=1 Tax=Lymantria dispar multicapsid nuclear polyhedrosis virus TaxID=10449 RepID=A0A1B1MQZ4_NPVLD|nr:hypothetical protein [Lymantria dispar multiple nucleopolyhedrovirus]